MSETPNAQRIEERRSHLWREALLALPTWPYTTALLWVAYRRIDTLEQWERLGGGHFLDGMSPVEKIGTIANAAEADPEAIEPLPDESLRVALLAGTVKSQGVPEEDRPAYVIDWQPDDEPEPIPRETWRTHRLGPWFRLLLSWERTRQSDEPFLLPARFQWRQELDAPRPAWRMVEIDRQTLQAAFPPLPEEKEERRAWWPGANEHPNRWVRRPEVIAEWSARWAGKFANQLHRHLSDMWHASPEAPPYELSTFEKAINRTDAKALRVPAAPPG